MTQTDGNERVLTEYNFHTVALQAHNEQVFFSVYMFPLPIICFYHPSSSPIFVQAHPSQSFSEKT